MLRATIGPRKTSPNDGWCALARSHKPPKPPTPGAETIPPPRDNTKKHSKNPETQGKTAKAARAAAEETARLLQNAGHTAYFAGGCVRDEVMGLQPKDYDIATSATPDEVIRIFPGAGIVGKAFGVVLVRMGRREGIKTDTPITIEVATFRSDASYTDARRPDSVTFSNEFEDAKRRDFTINALFLDPFQSSQDQPGTQPQHVKGRLIDHVDGMADIKAKLIRAVGDPEERLAEDHLRALRAARFAARFDAAIEPDTAQAITRHTRDLRSVSRERIGDEFRRMLRHPGRGRAVRLLREMGLADTVLGEHRTQGNRVERLPEDCPYPECLAALALDQFGPLPTLDAAKWGVSLALSNDERAQMLDLITLHGVFMGDAWDHQPIARQKRDAGSHALMGALRLLALSDPARHAAVSSRIDELSRTPTGISPEPMLSGEKLIAMGFEPGPRFGRVLDAVYDAQLEGRVTTEDQARAEVSQLFSAEEGSLTN